MKSEWAIALQKHLLEGIDPPPDGWKTVRQIAQEIGKTKGYASKIIFRLLKLGLAEKKSYRVLIPKSKTGRMIPHYRLLPKAKSP